MSDKKPNLEFNKIFAAVLVAGITAMLAGFIANKVFYTEVPEESAIEIDTTAFQQAAAGGPAKPDIPEPVLALIAEADIAKGEQLSRACAACHTFVKDGPNRVGPNMWDVVGNIKAHIDSFAYSDIFNKWHEAGAVWNYEDLNAFLWKPKVYAPGTKMSYIGMRKPEDRAAMIAWMRSLSDTPAPLPTQAEIVAEQEAYNVAMGLNPDGSEIVTESGEDEAADGEAVEADETSSEEADAPAEQQAY